MPRNGRCVVYKLLRQLRLHGKNDRKCKKPKPCKNIILGKSCLSKENKFLSICTIFGMFLRTRKRNDNTTLVKNDVSLADIKE